VEEVSDIASIRFYNGYPSIFLFNQPQKFSANTGVITMNIKSESPQSVVAEIRANISSNKNDDTSVLNKQQILDKRKDSNIERFQKNENQENISKEDQINTSKTAMLLDLVKHFDFFHDEQKQPYVTLSHDDYCKTLEINSKSFTDWLAHEFWKRHGKTVQSQVLNDALQVMKGRSIYDGNCISVYSRVGVFKWQNIYKLGKQKLSGYRGFGRRLEFIREITCEIQMFPKYAGATNTNACSG
jgi:hypothetical protein